MPGSTRPPRAGGGVFVGNAPTPVNQASTLPLAGFWIQFAGILVDGILFHIVDVILRVIFLSSSTITVDGPSITTQTGPTGLVYLIVMELAYVRWSWTNRGATPGQILVGITVVDMDSGGNVKASQAAIRCIGMIISGIPILIGYIWAVFDPKKQGWMDKIANTQVVKAR